MKGNSFCLKFRRDQCFSPKCPRIHSKQADKRGYFPGNLRWATKLTQVRNRGPMRFNGFAAGLVWHAIAQGQFRRLSKYLSRARL
jgi:hypothetical protein